MGANLIYARVSTDEQDLDHQQDNLWEYATETLGLSPETIDVLSDTKTGRTTERPGFIELMDRVEGGEVERVIIREITRLGRSFRDIHETVHKIVEDHEVGFYVTDDNIEIEPGDELSMRDKMFVTLLGWGAELEAEKLRENTRSAIQAAREQGKWVGRPPYGFTTEDGYLVATDDYGKALSAIYAKDVLGWSDRKAAQHSGVPRRTLANIMDRKDLYLPDEEFTVEGREVETQIPDDQGVDYDALQAEGTSVVSDLRDRLAELEEKVD